MKKFFKKSVSFVKKYLTIFIVIFIFLFLAICDNVKSPAGNMIINNLRSIATSFTPTTDLFDDGSEVSFVSYFFGMKLPVKNEKAVFYLPTNRNRVGSNDDFLSYKYDGIIKNISKGTVKSVGYTQNNEKYIEIEHFEGYVSRYVGLSSIGVSTGEKILEGNPIGIVSKDFLVKIFIHKNNDIVKISSIEWKN